MSNITSFLSSLLVALVVLALSPAGQSQAAEDIAISAGDRGGPSYALGRGVCRLIERKADGMSCGLLPAPRGDAPESYSNLFNVQNGAADFAIARSDWQHFAITGTGPVQFIDDKLGNLRSVMALHSQPVTLIVRRDSGIDSLDDLKGKRINVDRPFTETRASADLVMSAKKWTKGDFVLAEELTGKDQTLAFCGNRVQAIFLTGAHPIDAAEQVTRLCDGKLIDVSGGAIDELVSKTPYLAKTQISSGTYEGMSSPVTTFGVTTTLVTSADVSDEVVYRFVKALFENMSDLKKLHPALRRVDPSSMIRSGLSAPMHPGAERYYREQGLM